MHGTTLFDGRCRIESQLTFSNFWPVTRFAGIFKNWTYLRLKKRNLLCPATVFIGGFGQLAWRPVQH